MSERVVMDPAAVVTGIAPAAPVPRAVGTIANGIGDITPGLPAGTAENDVLVMFIETDNQAVTPPSGWAHVSGSPVAVASVSTTRLTVLWKRAGASETAPTVSDPGDHIVARIIGVSGCVTSGDPWDVTATGAELVSDTSVSIPGATTTVNNCLVLLAVATGTDVASTAHISSFVNADLSTVTERVDNWVTDGTGGGIGVASGVKLAQGAYAATTATLGTANVKALMSIALKPVIRTEVDITPFIAQAGPDYGDAAIEQYLAKGHVGSTPVDYDMPNRTITIPLVLMERDGVTFEEIRTMLQAKVGRWQREGGWVMREVNGVPWYADVTNATLKMGGSSLQAWGFVDADAVLTLETLPDWYGDEIALDDMTETSAAEMVQVLKLSGVNAVIPGDYPARVRIVVDEDQGQSQLGLLWGIRSRHYSSAPTAALAYEAEALTVVGAAAIATVTGASGGGSVMQATNVGAIWTPVLSTDHAVSGALTHTGTYRVWVRAHSSTGTPRLRLLWGVGDLALPSENRPVTLPGESAFYDVDLGEIRLDAAPVGSHRWRGQIQAYGDGTDTISLDKVWIVPVDDGYGVLRAEAAADATLAAFSARDDFTGTTSGGTLNTRTPLLGAAWATSGEATDFAFIDAAAATGNTSEAVSRSVSSTSFRYGVLGSNMTDQQVQAQVGIETDTSGDIGIFGVIARWTDANNHLRLVYVYAPGSGISSPARLVRLEKVVAGVRITLASASIGVANAPYLSATLRLTAYQSGAVHGEVVSSGGVVLATLAGSDSVVATAGTLASGKGGIIDSGNGTTAMEHWYDDVTVSEPLSQPAVVHASQSCQLRHDGAFRESNTGTTWGPLSAPVGDLPRLPPSGMEGRPVELFLKLSRGDFDQIADSAIDDFSAQVSVRPSYLFVPGQ